MIVPISDGRTLRLRRAVSEPGERPIRALSIRQPWAWAIQHAGKRVENRSWHTSYRGPIFIHAGLTVDYNALDDLEALILAVPEPRPPAFRGALLATATLTDCVRPEEVPSDQRGWAFGPWCFILEDVQTLAHPIPMRGKLGFFDVRTASSGL